jgi:hypothetical protein
MKAISLLCMSALIAPLTAIAAESSPRIVAFGGGLPTIEIRSATALPFPGGHFRGDFFNADSNSPTHWSNGTLYAINSEGAAFRSSGADLLHLGNSAQIRYQDPILNYMWLWIESTSKAADGTLYGWYHQEILNRCPPRHDAKVMEGYPAFARIGALRSTDDGATWKDLGYVVGGRDDDLKCQSGNIWYAGGAGDFAVVLDKDKQYFYLYFTNYPTEPTEQGVAVARVRYADRDAPVAKVERWYRGGWVEPGLGGHSTPVFPATGDLFLRDAQSYWGPVIHWNTYLQRYVMILNRFRDTTWATEGIYMSFNRDIGDPLGWSKPTKIMDRDEAIHGGPPKRSNGFYAELVGTSVGETDKIASQNVRLFLDGVSRWEITFRSQ